MLERWGTISLAHAVGPAARFAEEGFPVDNRVAAYWQSPSPYPGMPHLLDNRRKPTPSCPPLLTSDGRPSRTGDVIRNRDYAATLRHIGASAADDFYAGSLAGRIAADLAAVDGVRDGG